MNSANKSIFLIEDDSAIADIYKTLLEKFHFKVCVFNTGQQVLKSLENINAGQEKKPDIILLDLILPDISGIEVLKKIRNNDSTKNIKVFILTNQGDVKFDQLDLAKPDKIIIKANITPTQLADLIKEELK